MLISQSRVPPRSRRHRAASLYPASRFTFPVSLITLYALLCLHRVLASDAANPGIQIPQPGDTALHVLTPQLLELVNVNTKPPGGAVNNWDWVTNGIFGPLDLSGVTVTVNGQVNNVVVAGFKRRPIYAPQAAWDLRIGNALYLQLNTPIADGQSVQVVNNGTLWPVNMQFATTANPFRFSPA